MIQKLTNHITSFIFSAFVYGLSCTLVLAQTAALLPNALQQYFDANGNPLSGGTVTFYYPSTLNLKPIWQDALEATPYSNPLTLNAAGEPPSATGIYGQGTYRQIVKDISNNLIWDAVTAAPGTFSQSGTGDGDLVGTIKSWAGIQAPNQYLFSFGQQISRITYSVLFTAITQLSSVSCTSGSAVLSGISDTTQIPVGAPVEVSCVVPGTTVTSKTSSSVTLSNTSSLNTNTNATFFPFGNGDGSTTFTLPDLRGNVVAGRPNMGGTASTNLTNAFCSNATATGIVCGSQSKTLKTDNLPNISPVFTGTQQTWGANQNFSGQSGLSVNPGSGALIGAATATQPTVTITPAGTNSSINGNVTQTAFASIQPTLILNYIIKVLPDVSSAIANGVTSLGGMTGSITCGTNLSCTGNNVSISIAGGTITNSMLATATQNTVKGAAVSTSIADLAIPSCSTASSALIWTTNTGFGCNSVVAGGWLNTRLSKTSAYTALTADCGSTIALSGSSTYALTFSAASGYAANCIITVINEDVANGKALNINGLPGAILWPLQPITIFAQNNVWQRDPAQGRWKLPSSETLQVNHTSGTDTLTCTGAVGGVAGNNKCPNDCLGTGASACATIQNAVNTIAGQWDCQNNAPTIQLAAETFTEAVVMRGIACPGYLQTFITGIPATPTNVKWTCPSSNACLSVRDYAIATVNGVQLLGGATGSIGFQSSQFGDLDVLNVDFGNFHLGYHWQINQNGNMNCNGGTYNISGTDFITHWFMQGGGSAICGSQAITVANAATFTNWLQIQGPSYLQANGTTFSGTGSGAGSTGQKYNISLNGVALTAGVTLPGATAGTTATGGQFN